MSFVSVSTVKNKTIFIFQVITFSKPINVTFLSVSLNILFK